MHHLDAKKLSSVFLWLPLLIVSILFLGMNQPTASSQEHPMDHEHGGMSMVMDEPMNPAAQAKLLADKRKASLIITLPVFSFFWPESSSFSRSSSRIDGLACAMPGRYVFCCRACLC